MAQYSYRGLTSRQIFNYFPGCVPCNCYDKRVYELPRYDVNIRFGTTQYSSDNRIIDEITVECDCCGARQRFDVRRYGVFSGRLDW